MIWVKKSGNMLDDDDEVGPAPEYVIPLFGGSKFRPPKQLIGGALAEEATEGGSLSSLAAANPW